MNKRVLFSNIFLATLILLASPASMAIEFGFQNLSEAETKNVIKEFSGNFSHTAVAGAGPLGKIFGFEVGVVGGTTKTDEINTLAKRMDGSAEATQLYHGGILGSLSVPLGLTIDAVFVPKVGSEEFEFRTTGVGVKWTLTDSLLSLPLDLAIRGHFNKTTLEFVNKDSAKVDFSNTVTGISLLAGKSLLVVTPYVGLGWIKGEGEFKISGPSFLPLAAQSYSANASSPQYLAGLEVNLLLIRLGFEYANHLDINRISGKVAFGF